MEEYIFISYSTQNRQVAFSFKHLLEQQNYNVWIAPNDIPIGERYANIIEKSIRNCKCLLLIMTEAICYSQWINKEIERAINYKKPVFGVMFEQFELNDEFKFLLSNTQVSQCVKSVDINDSATESILRDIAKLFAGESYDGRPLNINKFSNIEQEKTMTKAQLVDISRQMIAAFCSGAKEAINILSNLHFADVNQYVYLTYDSLPSDTKKTIADNLICAYDQVQLDGNIIGRREYAIKGQLIFYLTRLCSSLIDSTMIDKLKNFYYRERNVWQRQSLAYGLASLGEYTVPCEFAKRIFHGGDEDVVNRSWTLIFFNDVVGKDPYLYLDDGTAKWDNCRKARINRLNNPQGKMAYRSLDLSILYTFYESRKWQNIDKFDYETIKKCNIICKDMPKEVKTYNKKVYRHLLKKLKQSYK